MVPKAVLDGDVFLDVFNGVYISYLLVVPYACLVSDVNERAY